MEPTVGGFIEFVINIMQPPAPFDPNTSPFIPWSFNAAINFINSGLLCIPAKQVGFWTIGTIATYNLAADTLINIAQDGPSDPIYKDGLKYWAYLRKQYNLLSFIPGIVQTSSDENTSVGYMIPDGFAGYTIANLQQLKTPYGRAYLGYAQSWGTLWGLS